MGRSAAVKRDDSYVIERTAATAFTYQQMVEALAGEIERRGEVEHRERVLAWRLERVRIALRRALEIEGMEATASPRLGAAIRAALEVADHVGSAPL